MFGFLFKANADEALDAVHFALRRITHKQLPSTDATKLLSGQESPNPAVTLGRQVLEEIEQVENRSINALSAEKANYYKNLLATLVQNVAEQTLQYQETDGRDLLKEWRAGRPPPVGAISVENLSLNAYKMWGITLYLIFGTSVAVYLTYAVWPGVTPDSSATIIPKWVYVTLSPESRFLLLAIFAGAVGSFLHTIRSFYWDAGNRTLSANWMWFYVLHPFVGMALALIGYFVLRTGFLSPSASVTDINFPAVAAFSALVGLFSANAVAKLSEVANTIFRPRHKSDVAKIKGRESHLKELGK